MARYISLRVRIYSSNAYSDMLAINIISDSLKSIDEIIILLGKKAQNVLGQASLKSLKKLVPTIVQLVAMHCLKAIPNLKVAVAGQVFTNLLVKVQFFIRQIILMVWKEQKHNVAVVKHTWVMFLKMVRHQLIYATALMV